jgi:1-acyl-sn-glycerol-3-phosphate acyltransferase
MAEEQKYKYYPGVHGFLRFFQYIYSRLFNISANISSEDKNRKGPYLLLANHIGTWDPFVIGGFLKTKIHFVSSDAVFRDKFMRFFLTKMGVIPKKKNVKDTKVIRTMISLVKNGSCIGLFPEGSRSWIGRTMYIDESTAKLIKLLKVPVMTAKMKGMQLFNPRWGTVLRKTKVRIDYEVSLTREDILVLSEEEILTVIREKLMHNEVDYQRIHMNKLTCPFKAKYISYALFTCPNCHSIGKINSDGNNFHCTSCMRSWHVNPYGFFESENGLNKFDNIIDWYDWQLEYFRDFIQEKINESSTDILFSDRNMILFKEKNGAFRRKGIVVMNFYLDRIELVFKSKKKLILPISKIQTLSPQLRERIEISFEDNAYRIKGRKKGVSGLKWEIACNTVWKSINQDYKLSSYLK